MPGNKRKLEHTYVEGHSLQIPLRYNKAAIKQGTRSVAQVDAELDNLNQDIMKARINKAKLVAEKEKAAAAAHKAAINAKP